jgi:uncharacterized protein YdeI (YjbR/CyaY-like superfamily)
MDNPSFFPGPSEFRQWLKKNHLNEKELLVGYYKTKSGKPSMTWPESVAEALCFGWIDGVRRSIDDESYSIRFSPRKPESIWSAINIKLAESLIRSGLMNPAGISAFKKRKEEKSKIYGYEKGYLPLSGVFLKKLKADKKAWVNFQSMDRTYRKLAMHWVMNAKLEATQKKRLEILMADCRAGKKIKPFNY